MSALADVVFQQTPLWMFLPITILLIVASAAGGRWLGARIKGREADETERPAGTIVGANFALLAFLLAFTFNMTANRFEARKALLLAEVSAVGTAYLRSDFLPEPVRGNSRKLISEYVDIRAEDVMHPERLAGAIARSELLHEELWSLIADLHSAGGDTAMGRLYVQSLNDVIDLHAKRVTVGTRYQIPGIIWLTLYFLTIMSTAAMGYQFGLAEGRSRTPVIVLTLSFSAVIMLIGDLDRADEGLLQLSQSPMVELQAKIRQSGG